MDIQMLKMFFMWCTIIDGSILVIWTLFLVLAPDFIYRMQSKFFVVTREAYNNIIYSFLGLFKLFFIFLNVVPYVALLIITK